MNGRSHPVRRSVGVALAVGILAGGCAGGGVPLPPFPSPDALHPGSPLLSASLPAGDAWLRHSLQSGDPEGALRLVSARSPARPADRLLRSLHEGVLLHEAGRFAESNRALAAAEREVDRRYTRSLRGAVGSVLVNDLTLAYLPTRAEQAMIPYYRILNYLALGSREGALVEARKASAFLRHLEGRGSSCREEGLLHYVSGIVFDGAGERNDALVSFRNAERALVACGSEVPRELVTDLMRAALALGIEDVAEEAGERYGLWPETEASVGEVVVLLESGWVAHRAEIQRVVPVFVSDFIGPAGDTLAASAERIAGLAVARLLESGGGAVFAPGLSEPGVVSTAAYAMPARGEILQLVKLAWPAYHRDGSVPHTFMLRAEGGNGTPAVILGDLSARVAEELEARMPAILARSAARAIARSALTSEVSRRVEKEGGGEEASALVGGLVNLLGNAIERPDTRSWTLLPERVSIVRMDLPEGLHRLWVDTDTGPVELGSVAVRAGERIILRERVWHDGVSAAQPLATGPIPR
jgi:uncharacterized protein